jgi:hypothetical protein
MFHTYCSLDPVNKCISGQLEELAGVVKLEFIHRSVLYTYKGGGDLRMYDHVLDQFYRWFYFQMYQSHRILGWFQE